MEIKTLFIKYIKLRNKLNQAKIYKILDNTNNNIYIGSTCRSLKNRLSHHKSNYKAYSKGLYGNNTSYDIIKNNDYKIELIEACNIKTKEELLEKEKYYIQNNNYVNKDIPNNTFLGKKVYEKVYREANKDKIKAYEKVYYETNKDKLIGKSKIHRETNKDKIKSYRDANKYKFNEKTNCVCGGKYTHKHKATHLKSNKHQKYLELK